jgi:hypothetical protein
MLLLLSSLFWIVLKGALVLTVLVLLARMSGSRGLTLSGPRPLRAVEMPAVQLIVAGTLLAIAYACAGCPGFFMAAGVCLGAYLRARLIDWP